MNFSDYTACTLCNKTGLTVISWSTAGEICCVSCREARDKEINKEYQRKEKERQKGNK